MFTIDRQRSTHFNMSVAGIQCSDYDGNNKYNLVKDRTDLRLLSDNGDRIYYTAVALNVYATHK